MQLTLANPPVGKTVKLKDKGTRTPINCGASHPKKRRGRRKVGALIAQTDSVADDGEGEAIGLAELQKADDDLVFVMTHGSVLYFSRADINVSFRMHRRYSSQYLTSSP